MSGYVIHVCRDLLHQMIPMAMGRQLNPSPNVSWEPQPYKMCIDDVTSSDLAIEENPAYQSAKPQPYGVCMARGGTNSCM